jgi:hypothetical protein
VHVSPHAIEGIILGLILIAGFTFSQVIQRRRKSGR